MRILAHVGHDGRPPRHWVALFGSGLIGTQVEHALLNQGSWQSYAIPYRWSDDGRRRQDLTAISWQLRHAFADLRTNTGGGGQCDVIWAAGMNGFGSSSNQMEEEYKILGEISAFSNDLAACYADIRHRFHLVSSAGGLFEGQTSVRSNTVPRPIRSYGKYKLLQEQLITAQTPQAETFIYRPSSVYGFGRAARRGLFATMIANALTHRTTTIQGTPSTLRDFVFAADVGRFIARQVCTADALGGTFLLCSGKPTTMYEAIAYVEETLQRSVYRRFEPGAGNSLHMSFAQSALPLGWAVTPLKSGLKLICEQTQEFTLRRPLSIAG